MNTQMTLMVGTALIAALNPCSLSVLIMSIGSLAGKGKNSKHIGLHTIAFSLGVFLAQALLGLGVFLVLSIIPIGIVGYIALFLGMLICLFGLFEVKDYFWYGKGWSFKLSERAEQRVHAWTKRHHSHGRGLALGFYVSYKLTHYTAILVALNATLAVVLSPQNFLSPLLWALWYVLPLLFIAMLCLGGARPSSLLSWKEQSRHTMRLSIGLLYILIGWIVLALLAGGLKLV